MFKQIFLPILGVAAFIILVGLFVKNPQKFGFIQPPPASSLKEMKIGENTVKITLAKTQEERAKGLSGVSSLPADQGMLFVFDQKDTFPSFWMKDMVIPIDIIWMNDEKVAKIDKNIGPPAAETLDKNLKLFRPDKPIDYVLEVNAGFSDKNNIKTGDSVQMQFDL